MVDALWGEHAPQTARNALQVGDPRPPQGRWGRERVQDARFGLPARPSETDELDLDRFIALVEPEQRARARATGRDDTPRGARVTPRSRRWPTFPTTAVRRRRRGAKSRSSGSSRSNAVSTPTSSSHVTRSSCPELEALVVEHPFRERFRAQLMLAALPTRGRQADALEALPGQASSLPSGRRAGRGAVARAAGAPWRPIPATGRERSTYSSCSEATPAVEHCRSQPKPLIGRAARARIGERALLRPDVRLVTLTGPGGTGEDAARTGGGAASPRPSWSRRLFTSSISPRSATRRLVARCRARSRRA